MVTLDEIKPISPQRVMDLVQAAGMDVSAWEKFKGGKQKAASNPKCCYEWAFVEAGTSVLLNLWYENMFSEGERIFQNLNLRKRATAPAKTSSATVWKARASKCDQAIQLAYRQQLPIRVIVCDGRRRADEGDDKASHVQKRRLDPTPWAVTAYDWTSGDCILERGVAPQFPSDFPVDEELEGFEGEIKRRFVVHRQREAKLRGLKIAQVLRNNNGRLICEVPNCGFDFMERYGALGNGYAQVHHKTPLSAAPTHGRKVRLQDLAVVCANCHVMIHRNGECLPLPSLIASAR
jgi:5-methylcytosine-specific restriction enzyme A